MAIMPISTDNILQLARTNSLQYTANGRSGVQALTKDAVQGGRPNGLKMQLLCTFNDPPMARMLTFTARGLSRRAACLMLAPTGLCPERSAS